MNIHFRQAQPSDASIAVPLIYSAGPHEFEYVYGMPGKTVIDFLEYAFPSGRGIFSYPVHEVVTIDDQVVGIGAFYGGNEYLRLGIENMGVMFRFYKLINFMKIMGRIMKIDTILTQPEKNAFHIEQLAVKEENRGSGVGTALLQHEIGKAREKGYAKCTLDVAITNPQAQKLYERLGFKVVKEYPWKYPTSRVDVPGERRMELVL